MALHLILCPVDFSAATTAVLHCATGLALANQAELRLLHVQERPEPALPASQGYYATALHLLGDYYRAALRAGLDRVSIAVRPGEAAAVILAEATEHQATAIVLGAHGRTCISRFLMGSTAEQVLRLAPCPTVLIHRQPHLPASALVAS